MSEPRGRIEELIELPGGVLHGTLHDERIDFRSECYAIEGARGWVLIDPLPLSGRLLRGLGSIEAICLTAGCHQRAAWSLRAHGGATVHAPVGAPGLDEPADIAFEPGAVLPGALRARASVGPTNPHVVFEWSDGEGQRSLFVGDLAMRGAEGPLRLVPEEHREDPAGLSASIGELAEREVERIYPAHGEPLLEAGRQALKHMLGE